jgi:hypothetical protein
VVFIGGVGVAQVGVKINQYKSLSFAENLIVTCAVKYVEGKQSFLKIFNIVKKWLK